MAAIKVKKCFFPLSSWVYAVVLTCDDRLAVWFDRGVHHHHGIAFAGVPGVCCLYPNSNRHLYDLAVVWYSEGKFVHQFLYKKRGYQIVQPPPFPCAGCLTTCTLTSNNNPATVGASVSFTATIVNGDGTATPEGVVTFNVDGSDVCVGVVVSGSGNTATATCSWACTGAGGHLVTATFSSTAAQGFQASSNTLTQTCQAQGITTTCCPANPTPQVLHATVTGGGGCNGSYEMDYDGSLGEWSTSATIGTCVANPGAGTLVLSCPPSNAWQLATNEPGLAPALYAPSSVSCASPFQLVFSNVDLTGCGGTASATVSVTV